MSRSGNTHGSATDPNFRLRDLSRAQEILRVCARHGFGHVFASPALQKIPGLGSVLQEASIGEGRSAPERLVTVLEELGPTFVKLGQVLSSRPDVLPIEYFAEFERLQNEVTPFSGKVAAEIILEELGAAPDELFVAFNEVPVASASIAQVHRATLHDGREMAVKVQRPGIEQTLRSDLNILYFLAQFLEGRLDLGVTSPAALIESFDRAISVEVDFLAEAANAEAFRHALHATDGVYVPAIHRSMTSRRVLTMEWIDGAKLTSIENTDADRHLVMERLIEATYQQIFVQGIFHADPHPGNLVVNDDSTLTFLDFGLTGRITPEMRDTLEALFVGVIFRDSDGLARTLYRAASTEARVNLREMGSEIRTLLDRYGGIAMKDQDTSRIALDVLALAGRYQLRLPEEYAVLARSEVALDGIARSLVPDWDLMEATRPYAQRLASARLNPERVGGDVLRTGIGALSVLKDLPSQVDQFMMDVERGNLVIQADTPAVDRLTSTLDRIGRALIFGVGASAFLVASSTLLGVLVEQHALGQASSALGLLIMVILGGTSLLAASLITALMWNLFVRGWLQRIPWKSMLRYFPGIRRLLQTDLAQDKTESRTRTHRKRGADSTTQPSSTVNDDT